jgi:hypothetical protein
VETLEVDRNMQRLEQRYFDLYRDLRAVRAQLSAGSVDSTLQARLEDAQLRRQREMRAILEEIERVEDSLLE